MTIKIAIALASLMTLGWACYSASEGSGRYGWFLFVGVVLVFTLISYDSDCRLEQEEFKGEGLSGLACRNQRKLGARQPQT